MTRFAKMWRKYVAIFSYAWFDYVEKLIHVFVACYGYSDSVLCHWFHWKCIEREFVDGAHRRCKKFQLQVHVYLLSNDITVLSGSRGTDWCLLSCLGERCSITSRVTRHTTCGTMLYTSQSGKKNALFYVSWTRDNCFFKDLSLMDLYGLLYAMDSF